MNERRFFDDLKQSLIDATQWVVFEPNDEAGWIRVRAEIEERLRAEWRAGRLQGVTEQQAFVVRCDRTTMSQEDIDAGRLIAEVELVMGESAVRRSIHICHQAPLGGR